MTAPGLKTHGNRGVYGGGEAMTLTRSRYDLHLPRVHEFVAWSSGGDGTLRGPR